MGISAMLFVYLMFRFEKLMAVGMCCSRGATFDQKWLIYVTPLKDYIECGSEQVLGEHVTGMMIC